MPVHPFASKFQPRVKGQRFDPRYLPTIAVPSTSNGRDIFDFSDLSTESHVKIGAFEIIGVGKDGMGYPIEYLAVTLNDGTIVPCTRITGQENWNICQNYNWKAIK